VRLDWAVSPRRQRRPTWLSYGPTVTLSAADEAELAESIAEADQGEVISADELLRRLSL
jgi:hypothetical protein